MGKQPVAGLKELKNAKKLEIFRLREKNVPVESVDFDVNVKGFFFEPNSCRFAVLTEAPNSKTNLAFYTLANNKCEETFKFELNGVNWNRVAWAPVGQYMVVAGMGHGDLMWARLNDKDEMELLYKDEHYNI